MGIHSSEPSPLVFRRDLRQVQPQNHATSLRGADLQALLEEMDELDVLDEVEKGKNELKESVQHEALHHALAVADNEPNHLVGEEEKKKTIREPSLLSILWDGVDQVLWQMDLWRDTKIDFVEDGYDTAIDEDVVYSDTLYEGGIDLANHEQDQLQDDLLLEFLLREDM